MDVSITPNRISTYPTPCNYGANNSSFGSINKPTSSNMAKDAIMSAKSKRRIRNTINWLVLCSAPRSVRVSNRITIKNFKIAFITLTLPSKQMHEHSEIKKVCLNLFLTTLRNKFGVKNYVWKAELQNNGNIHFHLTIDKYVHYMQIRKYWNMAINKLGYVDDYATRMRQLSLDDYIYFEKLRGNLNLKSIKKAYAYGVSTNWQSPNSTDVKSVKHIKNFASYMAKYLTKPVTKGTKTGILADSVQNLFGRLWFCSQSLSKLSSYKSQLDLTYVDVINQLRRLKSCFVASSYYSETIFFNLGKLPKMLKEFIRQHIFAHCILSNYPFPHIIPNF